MRAASSPGKTGFAAAAGLEGLALRPHGVHTAAIFLPVKAILPGKLQRAEVSVFLLEIGHEVIYLVLGGQSEAKFVQLRGVLVRTDAEGSGEIVESVLRGLLCRFFQPQCIAKRTPRPAFGVAFMAMGNFGKIWGS